MSHFWNHLHLLSAEDASDYSTPGLKVVALVTLLWEQPVLVWKLHWNKKAKQLHECIWSCVASFYSKNSLWLPAKVCPCLFSFCWYILIWPNWPRSPCCHSVSKTGVCFWPLTIFSWCKWSTKPAAFMPVFYRLLALEVPWHYWKWKSDDGPSGSLFCYWVLLLNF